MTTGSLASVRSVSEGLRGAGSRITEERFQLHRQVMSEQDERKGVTKFSVLAQPSLAVVT